MNGKCEDETSLKWPASLFIDEGLTDIVKKEVNIDDFKNKWAFAFQYSLACECYTLIERKTW